MASGPSSFISIFFLSLSLLSLFFPSIERVSLIIRLLCRRSTATEQRQAARCVRFCAQPTVDANNKAGRTLKPESIHPAAAATVRHRACNITKTKFILLLSSQLKQIELV